MDVRQTPAGGAVAVGTSTSRAVRTRRPPLSSGPSSPASSHAANSSEEEIDTSTTSTNAQARRGLLAGGEDDLAAVLQRLPSSPKDLFKRIERQRDEMRLLQEENVLLKSREVEVSSLTLKLQQQFAATQGQVEGIKTQIQLQLANPISEEEYNRIDALPESKRDLLDTVKLGIYRQLGSLRASTMAATKRAAELAATVAQLDAENRDLKLELGEVKATLDREREANQSRVKTSDKQTTQLLELEATVKDLEQKLRNAFHDQEQFLTAKLTAQVKTDEAARLSLRLEESEMDVQRYKANAECNEQKLDILKSEYYELKLNFTQRILELESCLKAADEKLKTLGDLELESELFISTLAQRDRDGVVSGTAGFDEEALAITGKPGAAGMAYESYFALPRSRKLAHSLVVTKRCLHLENKVASLEQDIKFKDKQMARLQVSLEAARDALRNVNSPYVMVEKTLDELHTESEQLKEKIKLLQEENRDLQETLSERNADIKVLCKHRQELLRMRKLLKKLGVAEGYCTAVDGFGADMEGDRGDTAPPRRRLSSSRRGQEPPRGSRATTTGTGSRGAVDAHESSVTAEPISSSTPRQRTDVESARAMSSIQINF